MTNGLGLEISGGSYGEDARRLYEVAPAAPIRPARTPPPVEARPRRLSVTEIETWLRDPYAIYARHVLKLRPLDPLDAPIGPLERGSALHRALELFMRRFPGAPPDDAAAQLIGDRRWRVSKNWPFPKPRWPCGGRASTTRRAGSSISSASAPMRIAAAHLEIRGSLIFAAPGGDFELSGIADRIDLLEGRRRRHPGLQDRPAARDKQVRELLSPQLPLEAPSWPQAAFPARQVDAEELLYLRFSGGARAAKSNPFAMYRT